MDPIIILQAGVASGRKYFGRDDWFAGGATAVLAAQQADGSIPLGSWGHVPNTCFCTLFLIYGGAPVAFNKLEYGAKEGADAQDWNLNPRDSPRHHHRQAGDERCSLDAGEGPHVSQHPGIELCATRAAVVLGSRQRGAQREHVLADEPGIDRLNTPHGTQQQPRRDQQNHRHRDLDRHHQPPNPLLVPATCPSAFAQRGK